MTGIELKDVTPKSSEEGSVSRCGKEWCATTCSVAKGYIGWLRTLYNDVRSFMSSCDVDGIVAQMKGFEELSEMIKKPIRFALVTILIAFMVFVVWGGLAPLDSAVIAHGSVVLSENRKTIQHKEGGVIEKILVRDGESVRAGQELMVLSDKAAKAKVEQSLSQLRIWKAVEVRLLGEQLGAKELEFKGELFDMSVPEVLQMIQNQRLLFEAKMRFLNGKIEAEKKEIERFKALAGSHRETLKALESQYRLLKEQVEDAEELYKEGHVRKSDLFQYRRALEDMEGRISDIKGRIEEYEALKLTKEIERFNWEHRHNEELNRELREAHEKVLYFEEEYEASKDILERTVIKSPSDGIVAHMKYHTVGGVIHPATPLMEIIPQDDELLAEVQVLPKDIESVHPGLLVRIQLSAYKTRLVPRVEGRVVYVSADKHYDERLHPSQQPYIVRVSFDQSELERINYDMKLSPGMPVDVFIVKGERTFLQYMLSPIIDSFHKAFKEA
ncbi:HlyD family type I secretion periplasmic adaptor subunit [Rickettsiales endosymbiont of Peranema trichophorum]|uniref:HlyD family type I secretion periplasmic adaptor subunit n=1 Tax=Rickettsiales endosymbiont of Peranema trichophorum TaxID=2486577 RepID=UPI00102343E0|nr:HlyD family type I secretion periplasmic adaptor subunit [Rickettsiales endosymbiont of Peranema trichophorum]RZI47780.1 HlyD family type I secretion periplasmic adaptor subunit [Rickettsiales endosymbiont of Peranema trichophorum]